MNDSIREFLNKENVEHIHFIHVGKLPFDAFCGLNRAILFILPLSKAFVLDIYQGRPVETDEFLVKETLAEAIADRLAQYIEGLGYKAISQSEQANRGRGSIESAYIDPDLVEGISLVPHKAIGREGGLGFIGKNNLLTTKEFGSAFSMCTVLTDMPLATQNSPIINPACGECDICTSACPTGAIKGKLWTGVREDIVDVSKCACPLKCMVSCPWTLNYAGKLTAEKG